MKSKKLLAALLAMGIVASALTGCGGNPSSSPNSNPTTSGVSSGSADVQPVDTPDRVLKFTDQNTAVSTAGQWEQLFADKVKEYTKGHIEVQCYFDNTLCGYDIQPLQAGIADFLQYVPSSAGDLDPRLGAFDAPYIYRDAAHQEAVFNPFTSEPLKVINEALESDGVMLLTAFNNGDRQLTCNFPIYSLSDMKGAKIRVVASDLYQQLFTAFGAAATPMAFTEVATALITNVIDGQENPYSTIENSALYEIQKYGMETSHLPTNLGLWVNRNTFDSLTPDQQTAVMQAAVDATHEMNEFVVQKTEEYKQHCVDGGMTIITEEDGLKIDEFEEAAQKVYDYFADDWGDMVDLIRDTQ